MNKIFNEDSLIPYKDGVLVVDKRKGYKISPEEFYVNHYPENKLTQAQSSGWGDWSIVIASTVRIKGIPFIELPEKWENQFNKSFSNAKNLHPNDYNTLKDGFMEGYKAKEYSEQQLENAFDCYPQLSNFQEFKDSLQPKIKSIELEYEDNGYEVDMEGVGGMDLGDTCWMPKIELKIHDKLNNIIHPVKVEYGTN